MRRTMKGMLSLLGLLAVATVITVTAVIVTSNSTSEIGYGTLSVDFGICLPGTEQQIPVDVYRQGGNLVSQKTELVNRARFYQFRLRSGTYEVKAFQYRRVAVVHPSKLTNIRLGYFGPCTLQ